MNRQFKHYLQIILIVLDFSVLNLVFFVSKFLFKEKVGLSESNSYIEFWAILNSFWLILSLLCRNYAVTTIINFEFFTRRTVQVYLLWVIAILFYLFFLRKFDISRFVIFIIFINFSFGLFFNRFLFLGIHYHFKTKDVLLKRILIIGYNSTAKKLETYLEEEGFNIKLVGFVEDEENITELTKHPILSNIDKTIETAKQLNVEEIFSTITPEQNKFIYKLMNMAEKECIRFKIVPDLSFFVNKQVHIDYIRDMPILSLRSEPLVDVGNRLKKRALDLVVSSLVIVFILSWLIPILGILILLESKGPIIFSQLRSGKNNKQFWCLKFRSMRINKDANDKQATKNDSRVTRIGKFIRKTSLDEFPQFINVFKGEMSLVGPRPHMIKHTSDYSKIVDNFMIRQFLKPGITGWAQVNGHRGEIKDSEAIKMRVLNDLWYLENWNIWLDIRIIFLTVYKVIKGDENTF